MEGGGDMELAKHRPLLFLMGLHAAKDVVESADGRNDVRAFVQHDALGPLAHCGVRDFGA